MNKTREITEEVGRVILGKQEVIAKVLMTILSGGHILLEDVPGTGKTTMALAFSKALGVDYRRIQFTSDTMPSDVVGFSLYKKEKNAFEYVPGAVMTNLLLADEINRTSSKTQSALLEVMEEGHVTVDGTTHPMPQPFVVIATQNPVGSAGTQLLPQAAAGPLHDPDEDGLSGLCRAGQYPEGPAFGQSARSCAGCDDAGGAAGDEAGVHSHLCGGSGL